MRRPELRPDCGGCAALCCVALSFSRSLAFAFDKPAGEACAHLTEGHRCAIHAGLARRGMAGCAAFDCYGAGPRATRAFAGVPGSEAARAKAFLLLKGVHETLWMVGEAEALCPAEETVLRERLGEAAAELGRLASLSHVELASFTPGPAVASARRLLREVGAAVRAG